MTDTVDLIEIWMPVENGGQAMTSDGKNMELVALILNGQPLKLKEEWVMELRPVTKEESREMIKRLKGNN